MPFYDYKDRLRVLYESEKPSKVVISEFPSISDACFVTRVASDEERLPAICSKPHLNDHFLIIMIVEGCGVLNINMHDVEFSMGNVFLIRPGTPFYIRDINSVVAYMISYNREFINVLGHDQVKKIMHDLYLPMSGYSSYMIQPEYKVHFFSIIDAVSNIRSSKEPCYASHEIAADLLGVFLFLLKRTCVSLDFNVSVKMSDWELKICDAFLTYVEANYGVALSIRDFAGQMSVSMKTLSRITKKYFKLSPVEIVTERRIDEAKKRLILSSDSIADIAFSTGFNDPPYFFRVFKQRTGKTPSEYRKNY